MRRSVADGTSSAKPSACAARVPPNRSKRSRTSTNRSSESTGRDNEVFSAVVEETCALFSSLRIRYVIVGGVAASALGRVRSTLDVIVDLPEERIPDVVRAFTGRGFRIS